MGNALQVEAARNYDPIILFPPCPTSPMSHWVDVPEGYHVQLKLFAIPAGHCLTFDESVCVCCCKFMDFPLCDDCGCAISMDFDDGEIVMCLPAGRYQATLLDEDGDPVTPGELEVILKASIMHGPCPTQV